MPRSTKPKFGKRRDELRRNLPKQTVGFRTLFQRPEFVHGAMLLSGLIALSSALVLWSRDQIKVTPDQVMTDTRLNRIDFRYLDEERTTTSRNDARARAPEVYELDDGFLDGLRSPLHNLPVIVASLADFASISEDIRDTYALDEASIPVLAAYVDAEGNSNAEWRGLVDALLDTRLVHRPIVHHEEWQRGLAAPEPPVLLGPAGRIAANWSEAIPLTGQDDAARAELRAELETVVRKAGFRDDAALYVAAGIAHSIQPTYVKDEAKTSEFADEAAAMAEVFFVEHRRGDVIYRRGDVLSSQQLESLKTEARFFRSDAPVTARWLPRLGVFGLIAMLLALGGGFIATTYPRIVRNPLRITAICVLMTGMLAVTVVLTAKVPQLLYPAAIAPTLFVAIVLLLSYDQRLALFLSTVQCALVILALEQGVAWLVLLLIGCGAMIGQLREVRHRNSLIRASIVTAAVLGVATLLHGVFVSPPSDLVGTPVEGVGALWLQILGKPAWAVAASIVIGFLVLGILPSIEKLFDITTGMTLAELRDPSQPLLRQLQQRAPGTYNHSLQVASIAEAAADAIGADGLLVYVGALYHDIGKMNKPDYFIENQSGVNKHRKLRPAMSLLVIIGHVKDGIELAREYALPRSIQHFVESHHGTTLVEYFYHAAKTEAESDSKASVDEVEFRYPGPRPHTKEAAVLMLADCVESATRAMTEPNPSRIENVVRELARKRLLDGQFDECDLTFRELGLIEEAVIARLCAIHHGRISYPSTKAEEPVEAAQAGA